MKVSVVIPCFNEEQRIGECIDSINSQVAGIDCEIIVVDNGSTDRSLEIVQNKAVLVEHAEKRGPAAARNKGIRSAKGDVIVFVDADCIAAPTWLVNMIAPFSDDTVGCVAGEINGFSPRTALEAYLENRKHLSQAANMGHQYLSYAATANAAYRKRVLDQIGFFDEGLIAGEDADLSWRMQIHTSFVVRYAPDAVVYHPYETTMEDLYRQTKMHAYGAVMLYKKYKSYWKRPPKSLKQIYWEYRSIIRKVIMYKLYQYRSKKADHFEEVKELPFNEFQFMLELGWKVGAIKGAIRHKVWFV